MNATAALVEAIDTNQTSPDFLFWLAGSLLLTDATVKNLHKYYQLGKTAFARYRVLLMNSSDTKEEFIKKLQATDRNSHRKQSKEKDDCIEKYCKRSLRGGIISQKKVNLLAGLACKIDQQERRATQDDRYMATADSLFRFILDEWIDPLISFNVLIAVYSVGNS